MVWWIGIVLAVIGAIVFAIVYVVRHVLPEYLEAQRLHSLAYSDYGISPESYERWPLGRERFKQTGRLPMSRKAMGDAFRWHDPTYFWSGKEFCCTFEDGPWKWSASQRYAGPEMNCGHYFAVTAAGRRRKPPTTASTCRNCSS